MLIRHRGVSAAQAMVSDSAKLRPYFAEISRLASSATLAEQFFKDNQRELFHLRAKELLSQMYVD
jgi:hypothetical protein